MSERGRVIEARYPGTCPDCEERWSEGELIRSEGPAFTRGVIWRHDTCPDQPDPLAAGNPVCQTCWLTHPEGACDR